MRSRCCVCVSVYPPIVARQRFGSVKKMPLSLVGNNYETTLLSVSPHNCFVFYAVRVVSKESKRLVVPELV
jgi:hypothetical protein